MRSFVSSALAALSAIQLASAHFGIGNFYVNGVDQGNGICVRMNKDPSTWNFPVEDLNSPNMACGFTGDEGVNRICPVPDGAQITFKWREAANKPEAVVDPSHMGPCSVWMKKVDNAMTSKASGAGWFKIWDHGYDEASGKWCTTKLIENGGWMTVDLPKGLVGGDYLVRGEALALHAAAEGNPQYYMSCAQIFLESTGTKVPESTVSLPGAMSINDKSDSFNIWVKPMALPYPVPGPAVAPLKDGGAAATSTSPSSGLRPADCILEAGSNWCAVEVPDYTNSNTCWSSVDKCWAQADACWKAYPPTGYESCKTWQAKCEAQGKDCEAGRSGPPNKGKVLDPPKSTIAVPAAVGPTTLNGVVAAQPTGAVPTTAAPASKATGTYAGSWGEPSPEPAPAAPATGVKAAAPEPSSPSPAESAPAYDYGSPSPAAPAPSAPAADYGSPAPAPVEPVADPAASSPASAPVEPVADPAASSPAPVAPVGNKKCSTITLTRTHTATVTVTDAGMTAMPIPQQKGVASAADPAASEEPEPESCGGGRYHRHGRKHGRD